VFCNSVKSVPSEIFTQSLSISQSSPGQVFFADILRRFRQKICVIRDVLSSFTVASIIEDETADSLRTAILLNTSIIRAPKSTIRIDSASGFQSLRNDTMLSDHGITLDFGHVKNKNSNCVVDKAIQELELELLKAGHSNVPITSLQLQGAVDTLNTRIRNRGLSAKEIILQRDQHSYEQLNINDSALAWQQKAIRRQDHRTSAPEHDTPTDVNVGDLVFIKHERNKNKARDRFVVTSIDNDNALVQKMNDKFMSRKYHVPTNRLYAALPNSNNSSFRINEQSDEEEDEEEESNYRRIQ